MSGTREASPPSVSRRFYLAVDSLGLMESNRPVTVNDLGSNLDPLLVKLVRRSDYSPRCLKWVISGHPPNMPATSGFGGKAELLGLLSRGPEIANFSHSKPLPTG